MTRHRLDLRAQSATLIVQTGFRNQKNGLLAAGEDGRDGGEETEGEEVGRQSGGFRGGGRVGRQQGEVEVGEDIEGVGEDEEGDGEVHCCWVEGSEGGACG